MYFKERAHVKLHDTQLQLNLTKIKYTSAGERHGKSLDRFSKDALETKGVRAITERKPCPTIIEDKRLPVVIEPRENHSVGGLFGRIDVEFEVIKCARC